MEIAYCTLADVADRTGTVVVIDVLRAFSTAAVALSKSPSSYELVGDVDTALARKQADPECRLVGEVGGQTPEEFDHSNSPVEMSRADVAGRVLVHRSSAGTQGVVRARSASRVLVASFLVAQSTARAICWDGGVTFCITGTSEGRDGEEDRACADYITALLKDRWVSPAPFLERVHASTAASHFRDPARPWLDAADVDFACQLDMFNFAMEVEPGDDVRLLRRLDPPATKLARLQRDAR